MCIRDRCISISHSRLANLAWHVASADRLTDLRHPWSMSARFVCARAHWKRWRIWLMLLLLLLLRFWSLYLVSVFGKGSIHGRVYPCVLPKTRPGWLHTSDKQRFLIRIVIAILTAKRSVSSRSGRHIRRLSRAVGRNCSGQRRHWSRSRSRSRGC